MGTDVTVEGVVIPQKFSDTNPLPRLAHGITGIEIHFLPIVHTVIGVYAEPSVASHLHKWKGKSGKELAEDDDFFAALAAAPVELVIRVVVIKEIKASQFGTPLEGKIRDRLVEVDKFEDEEEEALEKLAAFFPTKYFKKGDAFIFKFSASGRTEIELILGEKVDATTTVENANVSETIKKLYLGGTRGISPTLVENVANNLSAELAK